MMMTTFNSGFKGFLCVSSGPVEFLNIPASQFEIATYPKEAVSLYPTDTEGGVALARMAGIIRVRGVYQDKSCVGHKKLIKTASSKAVEELAEVCEHNAAEAFQGLRRFSDWLIH